ncbi:MAG: nitroreductase family protein [Thermoplasmata archaeon]|nr:nitroreductase family protein [Thermoplasmata archaeon]
MEGQTECIRVRRSVRSFTSEPVSEEDIRGIMDAAVSAPSSKNRQPWLHRVYSGPIVSEAADAMAGEIEAHLEEEADEDRAGDLRSALRTMEILRTVPVMVATTYEDRRPYAGVLPAWREGLTDRELVDTLSIGMSLENMMLEAASRGLGTLCIGDHLYATEALARVTGIEGRVVALIAIGHPSENRPRSSTRNPDFVEYHLSGRSSS